MPLQRYKVTFRNGSVETVNADSIGQARRIVRERLQGQLRRGFSDISPASSAKLMKDAAHETNAATVKRQT